MSRRKQYCYDGKMYTAEELAEMVGISTDAMQDRLTRWKDIKRAVETKPRAIKRYLYKGQYLSARQLAKMHGGITEQGMNNRLKHGMSVVDALSAPNTKPGEHHSFARQPKQEPQKPPKQKHEEWQPHRSAADMAKCSRCRYSEKDNASNVLCMYAANHVPPHRRPCEPGKDCTVWEPKTRETEKKKQRPVIIGM